MHSDMSMLPTMATVQARIFTLPNRPAFMIADDLAEFYQTTAKNLMRQVRRNIGRFPDDFIFEMTEAEFEEQLRQNGSTAERRRTDLKHYGFTKEGALQLSSVLTGEVADAVSVTIIRAFAAMERRALEETRFLLQKLRTDAVRAKPIRVLAREGERAGLAFHTIWTCANYSKPRLAQALHECLALGLIDALPAGTPSMQMDLFGHG